MKSTVGRIFEQGQGQLIDYSSILVEVGARLREERERRGLSQSDFGALANIKRGSQLEYETGKRPFDANYLLRMIANGVDSHFVLTGNRTADALRSDAAEVVSALEVMDADNRTLVVRLANSLAGMTRPVAKATLPSTAALEDALAGFFEATPGLSGDELVHELATSLPIILHAAGDEIDVGQLAQSGKAPSLPVAENAGRRVAQPRRRS